MKPDARHVRYRIKAITADRFFNSNIESDFGSVFESYVMNEYFHENVQNTVYPFLGINKVFP